MVKINKGWMTASLAVGFVAVGGLLSFAFSQPEAQKQRYPTFAARRGPLSISVLESGTISAREQIVLKNEVEGRTSIISLIPEGMYVEKGQLLVELDASNLLDQKIDQEIKVQNAEASFISAKENFEVVKSQSESDVAKAQLDLEFAKQDLQKYLEGEYPNELKKLETEITLAQEELSRATETLKWSNVLFEQKYLSSTELEADKLNQKRKSLQLELSQNNLDLLTDFTHKRKVVQLKSDIDQAQMAFDRVTRKARANIVQAEADLKAKDAEYGRQKDKLDKNIDQIAKTKILAPASGLVIYATSAQAGGFRNNTQPLEEGQEVRERQELIYLPTANLSKASIGIREASLLKVRHGLPAVIKVDALPGKVYLGSLNKIAPLPDAQSMWMNPGLKIYNSEIFIDDNDSELRTGMTCQAEIMVAKYDNVVYVPVQSVVRVNGIPTVYVVNKDKLERREIEIGLDNNTYVYIKSGLREGEVVSLTPPLGATGAKEMFASSDQKVPNELEQKINTKLSDLDNVAVVTAQPQPVVENTSESPRSDEVGQSERGQRKRRTPENMTDEQLQKMRERFENMSEEERSKMREQFNSMSEEEKQKAFESFK